MEKIYPNTMCQALCKSLSRWGLYMYWSLDETLDIAEINKAAPFLVEEDIWDGAVLCLFSSKEEMEDHFEQVVGDEGPTERNSYQGPARVYAVTISNTGQYLDENT